MSCCCDSRRCAVKAKLGDFQGALDDANEFVKSPGNKRLFALQERGVLKYLMGDLRGALADLNQGLELEAEDYERLKHRGYVKFLLDDKEGARIDAERALEIKPSRVDRYDYGCGFCLGTASVGFMCYNLR
jgi:tetratricopeptide (TPR) repeat protein